MKILAAVISFVIVFFSCTNRKQHDGIFVDFNKMEMVKNLVQKGDSAFLPSYNILIEKAEHAIIEGPFSVMHKKRIPPSGDKHDYLSMGPYWWPDTTKADGLPYIRRDGEINPETRDEFVDTNSKNSFLSNVETLGWAYYFSGEEKYADKALLLIDIWFINPETKMNPNLNFAQGIPGICDGRGIGIIDWAGMNKVISTIQILDSGGVLPETTKERLLAWFEAYYNWLVTSEYGIFEDSTKNNHGTWYDVQVTGIELFLNKTESAKARLERAKTKRLASQIEPDGSQPHELARTKSLGYSTMNLRGFIHLANLGQKTGVDLWSFTTDDGRSIKKALDFLLPFSQRQQDWERQQLGNMDEAIENLKIDFLMAASALGEEKYKVVAKTIKPGKAPLEKLLYPLSK